MTAPASIKQNPAKRGLAAQAFSGIIRMGLTAAVIAGAVAAVLFTSGELTRRAEAVPSSQAAPAVPVSTVPLMQMPGYMIERSFTGQVEAQRAVDLSFELSGRLIRMFADEGEFVSKGQMLAILDTSLLMAEQDRLTASRTAFEAQLRFANQTVERNTKLADRGYSSQARLDEALARQDELTSRIGELNAALQEIEIRISKSEIRAPFEGQVSQRGMDGGETLQPGEPVLGLIETTAPRVRIGVPLDIHQGTLTKAEIEIGEARYTARLIAMRPDVDPLTRTRTALFELSGEIRTVFGQTARLRLRENVEMPGFWVNTTALKEGVRGQWNVLLADAAGIVRTASVEILHTEGNRVFVRGAFPEGVVLIDRGPHRVTPGQRVAMLPSK